MGINAHNFTAEHTLIRASEGKGEKRRRTEGTAVSPKVDGKVTPGREKRTSYYAPYNVKTVMVQKYSEKETSPKKYKRNKTKEARQYQTYST